MLAAAIVVMYGPLLAQSNYFNLFGDNLTLDGDITMTDSGSDGTSFLISGPGPFDLTSNTHGNYIKVNTGWDPAYTGFSAAGGYRFYLDVDTDYCYLAIDDQSDGADGFDFYVTSGDSFNFNIFGSDILTLSAAESRFSTAPLVIEEAFTGLSGGIFESQISIQRSDPSATFLAFIDDDTANQRYTTTGAGKMEWRDTDGTADICIERTAADELSLCSGDTLVSDNVTVNTHFVIPSGTTPGPNVEGALFLDTDAGGNGYLIL